MKSRILRITAMTVLTALGCSPYPAAQDSQDHTNKQHHHYKLIDLGTFGGPSSSISLPASLALNKRGMLAAQADTPIPDPFAPNCFLDDALKH